MKGIIKLDCDNKNEFQVIYTEFAKIIQEAKDKLFRSILERDSVIQIHIRKCHIRKKKI